MTERLRESLSALMDDEADDLELGRVLRAMEAGDDEVRETWSRYQLVSAVMSGMPMTASEPAAPLAVEFGKVLPTVGFDINAQRISELRDGVDHTLEVEPELLAEAPNQGKHSIAAAFAG